MTKPTATELIERIDSILHNANRDGLLPDFVSMVAILTKLSAHLSDLWISVEERLPEHKKKVLFKTKFKSTEPELGYKLGHGNWISLSEHLQYEPHQVKCWCEIPTMKDGE